MSKYLSILLVLMVSAGCATGPSVVEKLSAQSPLMIEEAVNPIINLVDAAIITYEETGKWPSGDIKPGKESKFSSYLARVSKEDLLESNFKLASLDVHWVSTLSIENQSNNSYSLTINGYDNSQKIIGIGPMSVTRGLSLMNYEEKKIMAMPFTIAKVVSEGNKVEKSKFEAIADKVVPAMAAVVICMVLDADSRQCAF